MSDVFEPFEPCEPFELCLLGRIAASSRRHGLRLRRPLLSDRLRLWLDQGERLVRTFVERHGLFMAVWSACQKELAPAKSLSDSSGNWPTKKEVWTRETMFDVLHSIQQLLTKGFFGSKTI